MTLQQGWIFTISSDGSYSDLLEGVFVVLKDFEPEKVEAEYGAHERPGTFFEWLASAGYAKQFEAYDWKPDISWTKLKKETL